jgi:hypothetical protein
MTVFDDGSGLALFVGGCFQTAGGVTANNIAKWDGRSWSSLGGGIDPGSHCYGGSASARVAALAVFDDGSGPALYAGGDLSTAGAVTVNGIARWDGSEWSPLAEGVDGAIYALAVFDDGTGPALYAAGEFTTPGNAGANNIAKWDGAAWSAVGNGVDGRVYASAVFDDGSGPGLYVGGSFATPGGAEGNQIAKWDGQAWSAVGGGVDGGYGVFTLTVFDDGSGDALYAGGYFTTAGGLPADRIARWDGIAWLPLARGISHSRDSSPGSGP